MLWCVVPFKPPDDTAGLCGRKCLIERCGAMCIQVVLNEGDFFGVGKMESVRSSVYE